MNETQAFERLRRLARRRVTVFDGDSPDTTALQADAGPIRVDVGKDATYLTIELKIRCPHPREEGGR